MIFYCGYNESNRRHLLSSRGLTGKFNIEEFEDIEALVYKVGELMQNGHTVEILKQKPRPSKDPDEAEHAS